MKIEIVFCDRCGEEIGQLGKKSLPLVTVRMQRKDEVHSRELCVTCGNKVKRFLENPKRMPEEAPERMDTALMEQLEAVRKTSADALVRYADGATADELATALRDVSSGARRR